MILEAALSEKNVENGWLPLLKKIDTLKFCYILVCSIVKEGIAVVKCAALNGLCSASFLGIVYTQQC